MPLSLLMTDGACGGSAEEGGNQLAQTAGSPNEHHQRARLPAKGRPDRLIARPRAARAPQWAA